MTDERPEPARSPSQADRRGPMRLLHVMALIAAVALILVASPVIMKAIMRAFGPASSWNRRMYVSGVASIALVLWLPILLPLSLIENRVGRKGAGCSHGAAAVFAASLATGFLLVRQVLETFLESVHFGFALKDITSDYVLQKLAAMLEKLTGTAAVAIVAAWLILALSGAVRKSSNGVDFVGGVLGLFWILWWLLSPILLLAKLSWLDGMAPL